MSSIGHFLLLNSVRKGNKIIDPMGIHMQKTLRQAQGFFYIKYSLIL